VLKDNLRASGEILGNFKRDGAYNGCHCKSLAFLEEDIAKWISEQRAPRSRYNKWEDNRSRLLPYEENDSKYIQLDFEPLCFVISEYLARTVSPNTPR
jgi:hypothetical protein